MYCMTVVQTCRQRNSIVYYRVFKFALMANDDSLYITFVTLVSEAEQYFKHIDI